MNSRETSPKLFGRRRSHEWMVIEGVVVLSIYLLVVTIAWTNDPGSPWRLGIAAVSWVLVVFAVVRGMLAKRRTRLPT
ncbi:MAG TPA: hypothetical protein VGM97_12685 [Steroidobacteraceae bacterium]